MNIGLTGASGYVGQRLSRVLLDSGHHVAAITSSERRLESEDVYLYPDWRIRTAGMPFEEFEVVVHLAASTAKGASPQEFAALVGANVEFTGRIAGLASRSGISRFINVSTYSVSVNGDNYAPQTLYAATKMAGEDLLAFFHQSEGLETVTLALYDVYGPESPHGRLINYLVSKTLTGEPIALSQGDQEVCPLFVDDAVDAIRHVLDSDPIGSARQAEQPPPRFSVMGPEVLAVRDLPEIIARALELSPVPIEAVMPYRSREIFKVRPWSMPLPDWNPQIALTHGARATAGLAAANDPNHGPTSYRRKSK